MEWNDEAIARLRVLWAEGHSTAEIGRRMGVSKNAVVGKAHRLNLTSRPSPIRRNGEKSPRRRQPKRVHGPTLPALSAALDVLPALDAPPSAEMHFLEARPVEPPAAERPAPVLRAVHTPRPSARVVPCSWPIGEPGTKSFRFCDAGSMANKPYCEEHCAQAYVRARDRREDAA